MFASVSVYMYAHAYTYKYTFLCTDAHSYVHYLRMFCSATTAMAASTPNPAKPSPTKDDTDSDLGDDVSWGLGGLLMLVSLRLEGLLVLPDSESESLVAEAGAVLTLVFKSG